jgi:hypothetical protein
VQDKDQFPSPIILGAFVSSIILAHLKSFERVFTNEPQN